MVRLPRQISLPFAGATQSLQLLTPRLEVRHVVVRIADLPTALDGFSMAQTSDLHVGDGRWRPFRMGEVVTALRAEHPDVVVDTGDFVVGSPSASEVARIGARFVLDGRQSGSGPMNLAVLGNHDFYAGDDGVRELALALEAAGILVLINRTEVIPHAGSGVSFVGLAPEAPGMESAVRQLERMPRPRIVLLHEPDTAEQVPPGSADLILAGHTHGGQIALPGLTRWTVRHFSGSRYVGGRYYVNGNRVYVNRGLGCTGLPVRFRAAPELTIIRLAR
jgi:predicted MPP superfamily phosphohydrolase